MPDLMAIVEFTLIIDNPVGEGVCRGVEFAVRA
jgi:hypothetical protein